MATSGEDCCSGGCVFGDNFKLTQENWSDFITDKVDKYWNSYAFPELDNKVTWTVYIAKPQSWWFKHHSVVMEYGPTGDAFTIELMVDLCSRNTLPDSKYFNRSRYSQLNKTKIGDCYKSAKQVFFCALKHLDEFGIYQSVVRNCQNYCKELAEKLTGSPAPPTDTDNVVTGGKAVAVGIGLGLAAAGLYRWLTSSGKDDDSSHEAHRGQRRS